METWRETWRQIQHYLPTIGLEALEQAIIKDNHTLWMGSFFFDIHGHSICGPLATNKTKIEAACAIGYPLWKSGYGLACDVHDTALALSGKVLLTPFWQWADYMCRDVVDGRKQLLALLLPEVSAELARRSLTVLVEEEVLVAV